MKKYILILSVMFAFPAAALAQHVGQNDTLVSLPGDAARSYSMTTGKLLTIDRSGLQKSGIGDLRNRMTGMIPGLEVRENGGGIFNTAPVGEACDYNFSAGGNNFTLNGFSNIRVLIDGVAIPFNQLMLEPNQIESMTVITDVLDKSKYGPMASNGAVIIKTRKGEYNTPFSLTVDAQTGVNFIDRLPEYVDGVDFARMNNISREAAGLIPLYSKDAFEAYTSTATSARYKENDVNYPLVNYKDKMLRTAFSTSTFGIDASAGSRNIKYHIALNGMNYGDLIKAEKNDYNKINLSASVSTKIGQYIEMSAGFMGLLAFRRKANINWNDYRSVPEVAFPLILGKVGLGSGSDIASMAGQTVYGVSKTYSTNYYAELMEGGRRTTRNRSAFFNVNVDIDFSWLLKGLKSKTYLMASSYVSTIIGKDNDYIAYYWDPMGGVQELSNHKGVKQTSRSYFGTGSAQMLTLYEKLYYDWSGKGNAVHAAVTYYQSNTATSSSGDYQKLQYFQGDASWSYKGRYNVEASALYVGSSRFKKGARWGFFPNVGLSWIATNENFLKDNGILTNLKLYAQVGEVPAGSLFGSHYLYQTVYSISGGMGYGPAMNAGLQWFGNKNYYSQFTTVNRLANPDLTWERLAQQSVGVDIEFLDRISLSADWFRWRHHGIIADVLGSIPDSFGLTAAVYDNYEANIASGWNFALGYNDAWGDFRLSAWASASLSDVKHDVLVNDEYIYGYQRKTGTSTSSIRGLECIGKYESEEEIMTHPAYQDISSLKVGDLKYKDQNNDGTIDINDNVVIGNYNPKLAYSVNLSLAWKNLDFSIVGTGRAGQDIDLAFSQYFTGTTGQANYSQFMLDELGDEFPRLDYFGVPNNQATSTFWLRKANWFKIQTVDIGYTFNIDKMKKGGLKSIRLDLMGNNLLTFTNIRYIDPEATDAGLSAYPLFRTVTFGVKLNF